MHETDSSTQQQKNTKCCLKNILIMRMQCRCKIQHSLDFKTFHNANTNRIDHHKHWQKTATWRKEKNKTKTPKDSSNKSYIDCSNIQSNNPLFSNHMISSQWNNQQTFNKIIVLLYSIQFSFFDVYHNKKLFLLRFEFHSTL